MRTFCHNVEIARYDWEELTALTFRTPQGDATSVESTEPLKLVFVLHGLGSRKERHLDICLRLAAAGFLACTLDARLHGDRQTPDSAALAGDREGMAFMGAFRDVALGTAEDLGRVADEFGATRYAVVGHSMGGFMALVAALRDKRVATVVNIAGSIETRLPPEALAVFPEDFVASFAPLDLTARAAEFPPAAVEILHGLEDRTVPVEGARELYSSLKPFYAAVPERLMLKEYVGVGHEMTPAAAEDAISFLRMFL